MTYQFRPQTQPFEFYSEFENAEHPPITTFEWPGEMEFETAPTPKRKSPGTDCGRSGSPAALVTQPGGRCIGPTPPVCPSVAGIVSVQGVGTIPFEYVAKATLDKSTKLMAVTQRLRPRTQRFLPSVRTALTQFVDNMNRFSMPIEAILTAGSYCCRCISKTNSLSNHSFADAFDLVGVRWAGGRETIVHNWKNPAERALLRRINACLRLSFATVIDYHRADHRDHFHCDMNRGNSRNTRRTDTLRFTQEALSLVLGRAVPVTGKFDQPTQRALTEFGGTNADALKNSAQLNQILDRLFNTVAAPPAAATSGAKEYEGNGSMRPRWPSSEHDFEWENREDAFEEPEEEAYQTIRLSRGSQEFETAMPAVPSPKTISIYNTDLSAPYFGGNFNFLYNGGSNEAVITYNTYLSYTKPFPKDRKDELVENLRKAAAIWDGAAEVQVRDASGNYNDRIRLRFNVNPSITNPKNANKRTQVHPAGSRTVFFIDKNRETVMRDLNIFIGSSRNVLVHELGHVWGLKDEYKDRWISMKLSLGHVGPGSPLINDTMSIMNTGYNTNNGEFRTRYFAHFGRAILGAFWGLKKYMIPVRQGGKVVANTVQGRIALLKRDIAASPPYTADRLPFNPMFTHIQIAKRA